MKHKPGLYLVGKKIDVPLRVFIQRECGGTLYRPKLTVGNLPGHAVQRPYFYIVPVQ
jgi:hypothetical protein